MRAGCRAAGPGPPGRPSPGPASSSESRPHARRAAVGCGCVSGTCSEVRCARPGPGQVCADLCLGGGARRPRPSCLAARAGSGGRGRGSPLSIGRRPRTQDGRADSAMPACAPRGQGPAALRPSEGPRCSPCKARANRRHGRPVSEKWCGPPQSAPPHADVPARPGSSRPPEPRVALACLSGVGSSVPPFRMEAAEAQKACVTRPHS